MKTVHDVEWQPSFERVFNELVKIFPYYFIAEVTTRYKSIILSNYSVIISDEDEFSLSKDSISICVMESFTKWKIPYSPFIDKSDMKIYTATDIGYEIGTFFVLKMFKDEKKYIKDKLRY